MRKFAFIALLAFGCSAAPNANQSRLGAGPDARHVGVYAYTVEGDTVTLFDHDGIETARVTVTAPSSEGRHFALAAVDGSTDEADVGRPLPDGHFFAPVTPETMLTAAMADKALADHWAAYQLTFSVNPAPRLVAPSLLPEDQASTTTCTSYACGQSCSPAGCAKPANTSVGCSNPSQLPATASGQSWVSDTDEFDTIGNSTRCNNYCTSLGVIMTEFCAGCGELGDNICGCGHIYTTNSWVASCPEDGTHCTVGGQYDAVPRNGSCAQPGSCTYSQGTVGCTPYH